MKRRLAALALAMLLCLPLAACQKQQKLYSATWFDLFDTVAVVQGYAASQQDWDRQAAVLYDDLAHYNQLFDIYNHYDDVVNLYDVNAQAAAAPVQVGDELYAFCAGAETPPTLRPMARQTSQRVRCCACGTMRGRVTPLPRPLRMPLRRHCSTSTSKT